MKKLNLFFTLLVLFSLFSCGGSTNKEACLNNNGLSLSKEIMEDLKKTQANIDRFYSTVKTGKNTNDPLNYEFYQ
jgi:hypothetical protein